MDHSLLANVSILTGLIRDVPLSALVLIVVVFIVELIQEDYTGAFDKLNAMWQGNKRRHIFLRWTIYSSMLAMLFVLGNKVQQFIYAQF